MGRISARCYGFSPMNPMHPGVRIYGIHTRSRAFRRPPKPLRLTLRTRRRPMRSPSDSERLALDKACAPHAAQPLSLTERLLRRRLLGQLAQLQGGRLVIDDAMGSVELGGQDATAGRPLRLRVRDPAF